MKKKAQPPGLLLGYFKYLALSSNIAAIKLLTFLKPQSQNTSTTQQPSNLPTNILNKIYRSYTWTTNKYFILVIIVSLLTAIALSYYGQHYEFNQQLQSKTEATRLRIEKTIKGYHSSLDVVTHIMLNEKRYLDPDKVLRLLKLTYTTDPNIKLFSVTWHPYLDPNRGYSAFGPFLTQQNKEFIEKFNKSLKPLYIYHETDILGEDEIDIIVPVNQHIQGNSNTDQNNKSVLLGYLKLPVAISLFLQNIQYIVKDEDLVKISTAGRTLYYSQQNEKFMLNKSPETSDYQFADEISFASPFYKISIGSNKQQIMVTALQTAKLSCIIILCLGGVMLLIYNLLERRKFKKSLNELGAEKLFSLQQELEDLKIKFSFATEENEQLSKQKQNYIDSIKAINNLEQQIKRAYDASLVKIKDSNRLLLKHYSKEKELTPVIIEKIFAEIYQIGENLLHNIVSNEHDVREVNLIDAFNEILEIFAPVITARSITIINKIDKVTIKINEFIFKQILISLLARSLYLALINSTVEISAYKARDNNAITVEINDNSINVDEKILSNVLQQNSDYSLPGMSHIQLELESIIDVIKKILLGDISTINVHNKGNQTTLLLPIEHNRSDKVIHLFKVAR